MLSLSYLILEIWIFSLSLSLISLNLSNLDILNWIIFCCGEFSLGCLAAFLVYTCYEPATLPVVTLSNVSRHWQMSPEVQNYPQMRITGLELYHFYLSLQNISFFISLIQIVFLVSASLLNYVHSFLLLFEHMEYSYNLMFLSTNSNVCINSVLVLVGWFCYQTELGLNAQQLSAIWQLQDDFMRRNFIASQQAKPQWGLFWEQYAWPKHPIHLYWGKSCANIKADFIIACVSGDNPEHAQSGNMTTHILCV